MFRTLFMFALVGMVANAMKPNSGGISTDDGGPVVACFPKCRYIFCNARFNFYVPAGVEGAKRYGGDNIVFTGDICTRQGSRLGQISDAFEAELYSNTKFTKISKWSPKGLSQPFSPSFFKPLKVRTVKYHNNGQKYYVNTPYSGIARETFQGNQLEILKKQRNCVVIPFKHWQVLDKKKNVIENSNVNVKNYDDCVSFTTL